MLCQQVTAMPVTEMKALMLKLVERYPDLVAGAMSPEPQATLPDMLPQWCHCGRCHVTGTTSYTTRSAAAMVSLWQVPCHRNHKLHYQICCRNGVTVAGAMSPEPQATLPDLLPQWCHCGRCHVTGTTSYTTRSAAAMVSLWPLSCNADTSRGTLLSQEEWAVFDCNAVWTTTPASPVETGAPDSCEQSRVL